MSVTVTCKGCGSTNFDLHDYESMMVLSRNLALFTLRCPDCGMLTSSVCAIPEDLHAVVDEAARKLGAGMGDVRNA